MGGPIALDKPSYKGKVSVEEALLARRTHRSFTKTPLKLSELSQLLWAADGVSGERYHYKLRTAPSAGALYPLDIYAVTGEDSVNGLEPGVYHYQPDSHQLNPVKAGDQRRAVAEASLDQIWMAGAPAMIVITAEYARCTVKYGRRGIAYTHIEVGHVGQNIFLQAEALGLKAGIVGAFSDDHIKSVLGLPKAHEPLLIMPVGQGR